MKFSFLLFLAALLFCLQTQAQIAPPSSNEAITIEEEKPYGVQEQMQPEAYYYSEVMPEFQGDKTDSIFRAYVLKNVKYPKDTTIAKKGWITVQYIIETDGSISEASIVPGRGISPVLDQSVVDVVKKTRWKPGFNNGKPVRVKKITRILFQ